MPKILITGFRDFPAGNGRSVQLGHVATALGRDHTVDLLVARRGEQAYVESLSGAGRLLRVPIPDGDVVQSLGAFRRAVRRQLEGADYDIVHFCDPYAGSVVLELARRHGFATVYDVTRSPLTEPGADQDSEAFKREHEACAAGVDLLLVPHESAATGYARYGAERVHVVPPGVDVDTFDWEETTKEPGRVLYLGTIGKQRGIELLFKAWPRVVAQRADAFLLLVGRTHVSYLAELRDLARALKIEASIDVQPEMRHETVAGLLARVNVCVAPGAPLLSPGGAELYPSKILEYLACRRAVVAPRTETVELLCRDREHALLFPPGDEKALADAIALLITDHTLAANLGQAGYDLVRADHTASNTRRLLRRAYDMLAKKEPYATQWAHRERSTTPGAHGGGSWSSSIGGPSPETGEITATGAAHMSHVKFEESVPEAEEQSFVAGEFEIPTPEPATLDGPMPSPVESVEFASEPDEKTVVQPQRSRPDPGE